MFVVYICNIICHQRVSNAYMAMDKGWCVLNKRCFSSGIRCCKWLGGAFPRFPTLIRSGLRRIDSKPFELRAQWIAELVACHSILLSHVSHVSLLSHQRQKGRNVRQIMSYSYSVRTLQCSTKWILYIWDCFCVHTLGLGCSPAWELCVGGKARKRLSSQKQR